MGPGGQKLPPKKRSRELGGGYFQPQDKHKLHTFPTSASSKDIQLYYINSLDHTLLYLHRFTAIYLVNSVLC